MSNKISVLFLVLMLALNVGVASAMPSGLGTPTIYGPSGSTSHNPPGAAWEYLNSGEDYYLVVDLADGAGSYDYQSWVPAGSCGNQTTFYHTGVQCTALMSSALASGGHTLSVVAYNSSSNTYGNWAQTTYTLP